MEFKFDANQKFQIDAIETVIDLLDGQPLITAGSMPALGTPAIANRLDLSEADLLANLHTVQQANKISPDTGLKYIEREIKTETGKQTARFFNFAVEMETGTGKTYVYIRTAMRLFEQYGLRKFIIVVPSVAVREGVLKTLQITAHHLKTLYSNPTYHYYIYNSDSLNQVRSFATSDSLEIMVMTIQSFDKASNKIGKQTDALQGETPLYFIQAARPVLILHEPQNLESETSLKALASLNPLLALRYSATHRNPYNLVYRLTPYDAYREGLVKRIEVASVVKQNDANQVYIKVNKLVSVKQTVTASLNVQVLMKDGTVKEQTVTVKRKSKLEELTHRPDYAGFEVDEINVNQGFIRFTNEIELQEGQEQGANKEQIFEAQLRYTVQEHFRKQTRFKNAGVDIKVLSLFFIDRVANYAPADGLLRRLFHKVFDELKQNQPDWQGRKADEVQAAYFAKKKHRGGEEELLDSSLREGKDQPKEDKDAYDLIMKDKERLLSFDEPTAFIFSHSALREGWDNPNIFQICTLNQTVSEIKKRQEVGRGVRLAVNQSGTRVPDLKYNTLTVVANQSYERYVATLQDEITEEYEAAIKARYGKAVKDLTQSERDQAIEEYGLRVNVTNAKAKVTLQLHDDCNIRKHKLMQLKPEFVDLWERIKHKTRYRVKIDTQRLVADVLHELDHTQVLPPHVAIGKGAIEIDNKGTGFKVVGVSQNVMAMNLSSYVPLLEVADIVENLLEYVTPPVRLSRHTLQDLCRRTTNQAALLANPHEFATTMARLLREKLLEQLVDGIEYYQTGEWYAMELLDEEMERVTSSLVPATRSAYDFIVCDSLIEKQFVHDLENMSFVKFYLKLPADFKVATPMGNYNPDWAIVMEDTDGHGDSTGKPLLYLVRETKGDDWKTGLRPDEKRNLRCGDSHFNKALKVSYQVVSTAAELPFNGGLP